MKLAKLLRCSQNDTDEKITDKALNRSIAVSVVGILFCMTCLFGMTWALFVDSVVTMPNTFASARYDLDVTVTDNSTGNAVAKGEDGYYTLDPAKIYTVTLEKSGTASTGFCHISVVAQTPETVFEYYTGSIPRADGTTMQPSDRYELSLSGISKVAFTPMWGHPSDAALAVTVQHNGVLSSGTLSAAAVMQCAELTQADAAEAVEVEVAEEVQEAAESVETTEAIEAAEAADAADASEAEKAKEAAESVETTEAIETAEAADAADASETVETKEAAKPANGTVDQTAVTVTDPATEPDAPTESGIVPTDQTVLESDIPKENYQQPPGAT